jgi:hypothetical protein
MQDTPKRNRFRIGWSRLILFGVLVFLLIGLMWPSPKRSPRELQEDEIRPLFHGITNRNLPSIASNLRGIYGAGRDPHIFVTFSTDANGIDQILNSFGGHGARVWKAGTEKSKKGQTVMCKGHGGDK